MNPNTAIQIRNLSKQYRLGLVGTGTLSHDLKRWWTTNVQGKEDPYLKVGEVNDRASKGTSDYVWALKDINLEIAQGDVVGIIGKNGAGKSTLLKLLSRVTKPTTGTIAYRGRIASLLEVGTGFHPEMTGRENIYMNGAIMGMTRHEISRKLDEIIAFAGVERYIDTPVKRYSSGMKVRLGFAVAAHLEPDILVVDEVLAVGDAEFQKKAIGKMQDVSKEGGRTVLFVSHNMAAVKTLCKQGIVLEDGFVKYTGTAGDSVSVYLKGDYKTVNKKTFGAEYQSDVFELKEITLCSKNEKGKEVLDEFDEIELNTRISIFKDAKKLHVTYVLKNENGEPLFTFTHKSNNIGLLVGDNSLRCIFPNSFLNVGTYYLDLYVVKNSKTVVAAEKDVMVFEIQVGKRNLGAWFGVEPGFIKPVFHWELV